MNTSHRIRNSCCAPILAAIALSSLSCRTHQPVVNLPQPPPINSIRVGDFQCDNAVIGQAVRNVFVETLARYGEARIVREGEADVIIDGTVTLAHGGSSSARIGGGQDLIVGKGRSVAGDYVSGVTSVVVRDGEILTSASWGQDLSKGSDLRAPESVAREAARRLFDELYRKGLKRRR